MSPVASILPWGLYAAESTASKPGPVRVAMRWRVATFHMYALPFWSPVASTRPLALNAADSTPRLPGSGRERSRWRVAMFHR